MTNRNSKKEDHLVGDEILSRTSYVIGPNCWDISLANVSETTCNIGSLKTEVWWIASQSPLASAIRENTAIAPMKMDTEFFFFQT